MNPTATRPMALPATAQGPSRLRVIPELRSVHVERFRASGRDEILAFGAMFDLADFPDDSRIRRVGTLRAAIATWRSTLDVLEISELLWVREAPRACVLAAVWKLSRLRRRRPAPVVAYAIENNDLARLIGGDRRLPAFAVKGAGLVLRALHRVLVDRIAFGSKAARTTYASILGSALAGVESRVVSELPAADRTGSAECAGGGQGCVFVGELSARKGVPDLLASWQKVEATMPGAALTFVGDGPLRAEVERWVAHNPQQRKTTGLVDQSEVRARLRAASVVVAPSRREGRWKEQIGLAVVDGLAAGATIVTTRHTGLADWLDEHGHHVVDDDHGDDGSLAQSLPRAIAAALASPLPRESVWASLPLEAGRAVSDRWLGAVTA